MPEIGEIKYFNQSKKDRRIWAPCKDCGKERWVRIVGEVALNPRCRSCDNRIRPPRLGEQSVGWKGGRTRTKNGYILLWISPDDFFHSMANKHHKVFEHRLVMAKHLGRCLLPWELVHHKGTKYPMDSIENRSDNRMENLQLLPSRLKHDVLTRMLHHIKRLEKEVKRLKIQLRAK